MTVTGNSLSGTYNGAVQSVAGYTATGLVNNETQTVLTGVVASGASARNAGTYTNTVSGTDANYAVTLVNGSLEIGRANLTLTSSNVTKTYDGTTAAAGAATVKSGQLFTGDTISGGSFAFTDKNAGTDKTVTTSAVTLNDGNNGGNYTVSYANNTDSSIAQLQSVAWTGGSSEVNKKWSTAANWAGGAIPDFANVANVSIPTGSQVYFDTAGQSATLSSLTSAGQLNVSQGSLTVNGGMAVTRPKVNPAANDGQLNISGAGRVTVNGDLLASRLRAGLDQGSTARLVVSNGSLTSPDFDIGNNSFTTSGASPNKSTLTDLNVGLVSAGAFTLSDPLVASNSITLNIAGQLLDGTTGGAAALSAPTIALTAGTGIGGGVSSPVKVATNQLSASTSSGGLWLFNTPGAEVTVTDLTNASKGAVYYSQAGQALNITGSVASAGGAITIDPPTTLAMASGASITSAGGAVDLQATSSMVLGNVNAGTGNVALNTAGSILSSPGTSILTTGALSIVAATGSVNSTATNVTKPPALTVTSPTPTTTPETTSAISSAVASVTSANTPLVTSTSSAASSTSAGTGSTTDANTSTTAPASTSAPAPGTAVASAGGDSKEKKAEPEPVVIKTVTVAGTTVTKPADQIVTPVKTKASQLMCRRAG